MTACVILSKNCKIKHLNDSKKIPKKHHEEIYEEVLARALGVGIGVIDNTIIDDINIYEATKVGMLQAIDQIKGQVTKPDYLLIDAVHLDNHSSKEMLILSQLRQLLSLLKSLVTA